MKINIFFNEKITITIVTQHLFFLETIKIISNLFTAAVNLKQKFNFI